jgi:hypothetical protein
MSDRIFEEGIDETIKRGLARWEDQPHVTAVHLVSAVPFFRIDDICFVTVIADVEMEDDRQVPQKQTIDRNFAQKIVHIIYQAQEQIERSTESDWMGICSGAFEDIVNLCAKQLEGEPEDE